MWKKGGVFPIHSLRITLQHEVVLKRTYNTQSGDIALQQEERRCIMYAHDTFWKDK